jgi:uncharacterized protein (DUF1697 family)
MSVASAVFLRGVNVGGARVFRPLELVEALPHRRLVNIGAAGTFVAHAGSPQEVERDVRRALPFETTVVVRPASEIAALVREDPFRDVVLPEGTRAWVAILAGPSSGRATLPVSIPSDHEWAVRILEERGAFAWGIYRRHPTRTIQPANVVERALGVAATTRWWETIVKVHRAAEGPAPSAKTTPMGGEPPGAPRPKENRRSPTLGRKTRPARATSSPGAPNRRRRRAAGGTRR